MNRQPSGPPNPRHARYRQMPIHWSGCPATIFLIVICCIVAAISQLGFNTKPVSGLYFSDQPPQELLEKLQTRLESIEEADGDDSPEYRRVLEQYKKAVFPTSKPFEQIKHGQVWRLVTPAFLHFGPMHLIFNMMWLWTLGCSLETYLRRVKFLLLVAIIAVVSNVAQALSGGTNFGGMSGVVYGLFGFVVVHGKLHPRGGLYLNPRTVRYMLIWLVVCFTGLVGPIANWAHLFGLFAGGAIGGGDALLNGGWQALKRRHEFRRAIIAGSGAIHRCVVCGKTEEHDADIEFRVGTDGQEYCEHHLPEIAS